jgi:archaellum component FlaC
MQGALAENNSYVASVILKTVAAAWNAVGEGWLPTEAIMMSELIELLVRFPTLAVPFLTDQIQLVQFGPEWCIELDQVCAEKCTSQWIRAAASLDSMQDDMHWNTVTQKHLDYMRETYATGLIQNIISLTTTLTSSKSKGKFYVTQHIIPVRNCNTIELLQAAVNIAESHRSALLFKSEILAAVTDLHWDLYGEADHIFSLIMYGLLFILFTLLIVMFDTWASSTKQWQVGIGWTLQGIKCIIFTGYFVWQECRELMHQGFAKWFCDAWNLMDATAYGLIYAGVIVQACSDHKHPAHSKAANVINAIAAVLLWGKLLHYVRPYKATGVLVSMIFKILMKLRSFMLVLAIVVVGFATAFYSVLHTDNASSSIDSALKYNTVADALRTSFSYMLGTYELAVLDAGPSDVMLSILWAVFSVIVSILLLNLLIAIISYNFEKVYETSEHSNIMEKTKVVILSNIKLSDRRRKKLDELLTDMPYIVTFKPYEYTETTADKRTETVDTITKTVSKAVETDVLELRNSVKTDVKSVISRVAELTNSAQTNASNVQADVNSIKADVKTVNTEVTALKQEVTDLKTSIQEILNVVQAIAQQSSISSYTPAIAASTATAATSMTSTTAAATLLTTPASAAVVKAATTPTTAAAEPTTADSVAEAEAVTTASTVPKEE